MKKQRETMEEWKENMEQSELIQTQPAQEPMAASLPTQLEKPPVPVRDRVLAFALLVLGYLVCRVEIHNYPLLGLVYGLILYGLTFWHFRGRMGRRALTALAVGLVFLLSHLLTDNGPVRFFARWLAVLLWGYGVYCAGGNSQEERLGDMFVPEAFKANILMPFSRLGAWFTAVFSGGRKKWMKTALLVLLGLGLALIPLFLVVNLLQYDAAFTRLLKAIFSENLPEAIFRRLLCLVMGVWMAALLMSTLWGSEEHALAQVLDRERWNAFCIRRRFLPLTVSGAMLIPLLLVYGLFFFSQWPLYTSAFTGVLPQGWTYADYAREGFFQLCAVCAINGVLYLFVSLFTRMGRDQGFRRAILTILCLCSLILAATAFSKMVLYIRTYGLTPNRVYASWAMALLTAGFLLALLGTYWRKLNMARALALLFAVMFVCLCLVDTDALIADYNVTAYKRGRLDAVDTAVFWGLGDSAAPAAARLVNDPVYGDDVREYLSHHGKRSFFDALCHGVPGLKARAVCQPYWRAQTVVRIRVETEDGFEALSCWYGEQGNEYSAGACVNADGSPYARGQGTFFDWETPPNAADGGELRFRLSVTSADDKEYLTNCLDGCYGEQIHITLTGSAEQGYTIARTGEQGIG